MDFCKLARENLAEDAFIRKVTTKNSLENMIVTTQTTMKLMQDSEMLKLMPADSIVEKKEKKITKKVIFKSEREIKKEQRMREISDAIAFYKNSSLHKFTCASNTF